MCLRHRYQVRPLVGVTLKPVHAVTLVLSDLKKKLIKGKEVDSE